jgi:SAM-dependent methyltransferase
MGVESTNTASKDAEFRDADSKLAADTSAAFRIRDFSFRRTLARSWREGRQHYGVWRTARELASAFWRAMVELTPSHRQARYGDLDYDLERSVNTTRANVSFTTQMKATLSGSAYYASDPWLFESIMQALPIYFEEFTFIDLGSGKGRALMLAAEYLFRRIVGVELMPELHQACEENIQAYKSAGTKAPNIESICMDARDFHFPPEPLVIYLFNPFPEPVFAAVLKNLRASAFENPRPIFIAYRYVELERFLAESDWLVKEAGTEQWAIYRSR